LRPLVPSRIALPACPDFFAAVRRFELQKLAVEDALKMLSPLLNTHLIEAYNFTATYYGQFVVDRAHVCVLVKAKKGDPAISVEIKTPSQDLSNSLLDELAGVLV
jgi:hypothetical protein